LFFTVLSFVAVQETACHAEFVLVETHRVSSSLVVLTRCCVLGG
jgi:hypothetical protein